MSILDKVKNVTQKVLNKENVVEDVVADATGGLDNVLGLFTKNQDFAGELLNKIKLPGVDVGETVGKLFGKTDDVPAQKDFMTQIMDQVKGFLAKNPKMLAEVMKIASKFMK